MIAKQAAESIETAAQIPKEVYYTVGAVVIANVGTIIAFAKSMLSAAEARGANNQKMIYFEETVKELKKDINAAFEKIRSVQK